MLSQTFLRPPTGPLSPGVAVKFVRVIIAAAVALTAAAALQFTTSSAAGAAPSQAACFTCWEIVHN